MSSSFNHGQTLRIARDTATALGYSVDAATFATAFKELQANFHTAYFDPSTKTYGNGQQSGLVYALYLGAVPPLLVDGIFEQLTSRLGNVSQPPDHVAPHQRCFATPCIDTGIIGTKWLMELLSLHGRTDVGLDLAFLTSYPSWGYMIAMNSTTVWESWAGGGGSSHNHPAFASVGAWLYRWVAGLRLDDGSLDQPSKTYGAGFSRVLFAPGCVTDRRLTSVAARVTSLFGPIAVSWAIVQHQPSATTMLNLTITLPVCHPIQLAPLWCLRLRSHLRPQ